MAAVPYFGDIAFDKGYHLTEWRDTDFLLTVLGGILVRSNPNNESRPGAWSWQEDAKTFMNLLQSKRMSLEPLVTERVTWDNIVEAYDGIIASNKI